jgi:hypothetical protein
MKGQYLPYFLAASNKAMTFRAGTSGCKWFAGAST